MMITFGVLLALVSTTCHGSTVTVMPSSASMSVAASEASVNQSMSVSMQASMNQSVQASASMNNSMASSNAVNMTASNGGGQMSSSMSNSVEPSQVMQSVNSMMVESTQAPVQQTATAGGDQQSSVMNASPSTATPAQVSPTASQSTAPASSVALKFSAWVHECNKICCQDDKGAWKSNYETLQFNSTRTCPVANKCPADMYGTNTTATLSCTTCTKCSAALLKISSLTLVVLFFAMCKNLFE